MEKTDRKKVFMDLLIRGEQMANVEGAAQTAQFLQCTIRLMNYLGNDCEWGTVRDELNAIQCYLNILRQCFATRCTLECALGADEFIRRRTLLEALMDACPVERFAGEWDTELYIQICEQAEGGYALRGKTISGDAERPFERRVLH